MINKLKLGFLIAVLSLAVGVSSVGAVDELIFTDDTNVTINGNNYTIDALSRATTPTFTIDATTLLVTAGTTGFTLQSEDGFTLTNSLGIASTCTGTDGGTTQVVVPSTSTTTFTPTTAIACTAAATSSGGGGGGSRRNTNDNDNDVTTAEGCAAGSLFSTTTGEACGSVIVGCGSGNSFSPITGQACGSSSSSSSSTVTTVTTTSPTGPFNYDFGLVTVKMGSSGAFCRAWQNFFNNRMNAGLAIDGLCGPKTMAAARTWQASAGLVADGLLGPKSRAAAYAQAAAEVR